MIITGLKKRRERGGNRPVTNINLDWAKYYANQVGKRLPTENEWEAAARGSEGFTFPWGNEWEPDRLSGELKMPPAVNMLEGNLSPFGVAGMAGGVFEWTSSRYHLGEFHWPVQSDEFIYVVKGGGWPGFELIESEDLPVESGDNEKELFRVYKKK